MQIEVGKKYVARDGTVYGPIEASTVREFGAEDAGTYIFCANRSDGNGRITWAVGGTLWASSGPTHFDLVAEYVDPVTARDAPNAYTAAADDALAEVRRAKEMWPGNANSAHEQFAVTDEEIDELLDAAGVEQLSALLHARGRLWAHVKVNQKRRDIPAMRKEAIQVAAMALRFAAECCDEVTGRK